MPQKKTLGASFTASVFQVGTGHRSHRCLEFIRDYGVLPLQLQLASAWVHGFPGRLSASCRRKLFWWVQYIRLELATVEVNIASKVCDWGSSTPELFDRCSLILLSVLLSHLLRESLEMGIDAHNVKSRNKAWGVLCQPKLNAKRASAPS